MSDFSASEVAMKRFLTLFLCLCLVLTLTACGSKDKKPATNGDDNSSLTDNDSNSGSTDGTTENKNAETRVRIGSGNNIFKDRDSTLRSQVYGAKNGSTAKGNAATKDLGSSDFDAMLRNARVHDTDGDLSDLENSYTPGSLGW